MKTNRVQMLTSRSSGVANRYIRDHHRTSVTYIKKNTGDASRFGRKKGETPEGFPFWGNGCDNGCYAVAMGGCSRNRRESPHRHSCGTGIPDFLVIVRPRPHLRPICRRGQTSPRGGEGRGNSYSGILLRLQAMSRNRAYFRVSPWSFSRNRFLPSTGNPY